MLKTLLHIQGWYLMYMFWVNCNGYFQNYSKGFFKRQGYMYFQKKKEGYKQLMTFKGELSHYITKDVCSLYKHMHVFVVDFLFMHMQGFWFSLGILRNFIRKLGGKMQSKIHRHKIQRAVSIKGLSCRLTKKLLCYVINQDHK